MLNEVKIFFENLTHFRQILNESVGESTICDAIQKHKIVYIYYAGDNTIMKGYRTIKPMVLGHTVSERAKKNGEDYLLLRAWEVAGSSDSQKKYADNKGRMQFGWRLFRVDKITSFLPSGKFFSTEENKFPDVESYNPDDSQMERIKCRVELTGNKPRTTKRGAIIGQKPSAFDGQREKFRYFSKAGKKTRDITRDEIEHLWAIADVIKKKSKAKLWVIADEHGDLILKDEIQMKKLPPESILGNLRDLYSGIVQDKIDTSFIDAEEKQALNDIDKPNITLQELEKKTFFK